MALRTASAKRHRFQELLMLFVLTGCELIAGLEGTRRRASALGAGGGGGGATGSEVAGGAASSGGSAGTASPNAGRDGDLAASGADAENAGQGGEPSNLGGAGAGGVNGGGDSSLAGAGGDAEKPSLLTTQSCAGPTPSDCGGVNPCITLRVPGGDFHMGRNEDGTRADYYPTGGAHETPEHLVSLSPYWLDKYEVTVARFRRFVEAYAGPPSAGDGANPHVLGSGWQPEWNKHMPADSAALRQQLAASVATDLINTWSDDAATRECRPINFIGWYVAFAFCAWDGGRLPSEAEWEFAACGGAQERLFPWGNARAPTGRAVYACSFSGALSCTDADVPHVGSLPRGNGRFGHADLAGSMGEPVRDDYLVEFYSLPGASGSDPLDLIAEPLSAFSPLRGGYFSLDGELLRSTVRLDWARTDSDEFTGVRCARDL